MRKGEEIRLNIPFIYTIGEIGYHSGKEVLTYKDCEHEMLMDIQSGDLLHSILIKIDEPIYVLFGSDVCKIYSENKKPCESLSKEIVEKILLEDYGTGKYFKGDLVQALTDSYGWYDFEIIEEIDFNEL
jgi:hypothetical protein